MARLSGRATSSRKLAMMLVFLVVLPACRQGAGEVTQVNGYTVEMIERRMDIRMEGADTANFTGGGRLRIQVPNEGAHLNLVIISTDGYIDVGGDMKLSIGISLVGIYRGEGQYVLAPNVPPELDSPPDPGDPATLTSNSRVTFYADNASGPERTLRSYDTLTEPCPVLIGGRGRTGEVRCPEIRSLEGTLVSFEMAWGE